MRIGTLDTWTFVATTGTGGGAAACPGRAELAFLACQVINPAMQAIVATPTTTRRFFMTLSRPFLSQTS
jgi:hypothetical protein